MLQTTALVHEAYLRLVGQQSTNYESGTHFFAVAAQVMRHILVDYACGQHRSKRGDHVPPLALSEVAVLSEDRAEEFIAVNSALDNLTSIDPRKGRVFEPRYFGECPSKKPQKRSKYRLPPWHVTGKMHPERWQRIESIFHSAAECDPAKRTWLLDAACAGDLALRQEIESLLASHEKCGVTAPALQDAIKVLEQRAGQLHEGRQIGHYRVLRELGRGGMGAVYLAARADQAFQKLVAIKVIQRGLDTEDLIRRFQSERQILATLDDPNITRLLDAGLPMMICPFFWGVAIAPGMA